MSNYLVIPLKGGQRLEWRKIGYCEGYALIHDDGDFNRFLDEFESDFVESAIDAARKGGA